MKSTRCDPTNVLEGGFSKCFRLFRNKSMRSPLFLNLAAGSVTPGLHQHHLGPCENTDLRPQPQTWRIRIISVRVPSDRSSLRNALQDSFTWVVSPGQPIIPLTINISSTCLPVLVNDSSMQLTFARNLGVVLSYSTAPHIQSIKRPNQVYFLHQSLWTRQWGQKVN